MTYTRTNVYNLPPAPEGEWPDWYLWYAKGVQALQALPLTDKFSWRYYAAIHGFNAEKWEEVDQYTLGEYLPGKDERDIYWDQCQHRSWYFLPWHRGYLYALEETLRDTISKLPNGPDDWSFCYWNYYEKGQNSIPAPFLAKLMPDGTKNPLYIEQRRRFTIPSSQIGRWALKQPYFTAWLILAGFGGPKTGFMWSGTDNGALENDPHNIVHGTIGGLMGRVVTAAIDPIFWLHHANVDRMWEIWVRAGGKNPTETDWLNGPIPSNNGRVFTVPRVSDPAWTFTPCDMTNIAALGYTYDSFAVREDDDVSSADVTIQPAPDRFQALPKPSIGRPAGVGAMPFATPELVGAQDGPVTVVGYETDTTVEVDNSARPKLASLMASPGNTLGTGNQLAMKIENVTGNYDAVTLSIFIVPPTTTDLSGASDLLVGSIGLFGLEEASDPNGAHGGAGLSFILDLTEVISGQGWQGEDVTVRIVSLDPVPNWANITIGKISIFLLAGG